jgi:hypothetical protein
MTEFLFKILQLVVAIILILLIIIFIIPLFFKDLKSLETKGSAFKTVDTNYSVKIIDGVMPLTSSEVFVTTQNKDDLDYVNIPHSINRSSGSQFSFSFWLNKGKDLNISTLSNKTLLLFGLKNKENLVTKEALDLDTAIVNTDLGDLESSKVQVLESNNSDPVIYPSANPGIHNYRSYIITQEEKVIIKCPMISFGEDGKKIIVSINTINNIEKNFIIDSEILSTLDADTWKLLTFTFEDYKNILGFSNGLKMTFYLDDKQVSTQKLNNIEMRLNNGKIYILPDMKNNSPNLSSNKGSIADVTYFNRSINLSDIRQILSSRFNSNIYKTPRMKNNELTDQRYNALSLYAETQEL